MADIATRILTELGQIRAENKLMLRGLRHIIKQQDAILKEGSKPRMALTPKRLYEDYIEPLNKIWKLLAWGPVAPVLHWISQNTKVQDVLAKLSAFF